MKQFLLRFLLGRSGELLLQSRLHEVIWWLMQIKFSRTVSHMLLYQDFLLMPLDRIIVATLQLTSQQNVLGMRNSLFFAMSTIHSQLLCAVSQVNRISGLPSPKTSSELL